MAFRRGASAIVRGGARNAEGFGNAFRQETQGFFRGQSALRSFGQDCAREYYSQKAGAFVDNLDSGMSVTGAAVQVFQPEARIASSAATAVNQGMSNIANSTVDTFNTANLSNRFMSLNETVNAAYANGYNRGY